MKYEGDFIDQEKDYKLIKYYYDKEKERKLDSSIGFYLSYCIYNKTNKI